MLNEEMSAGTKAEQSANDETQVPSANAIGNTNVVGSQSHLSVENDYLKTTVKNRSSMQYRGIEIMQRSPVEPVNEHFQYSSTQYLRICRGGLMQRLFRLLGLQKLL